MASSLREKFDKKKQTKKKHLIRRINEIARQVNQMDKTCGTCGVQFDPKVTDALDTWFVSVGPAGSTLTCPSCRSASRNDGAPTSET